LLDNSNGNNVEMFIDARDDGGTTTYGQVGTLSNHDVRFLTNDLTRMTITDEGNIGIGTSSPDAKLHINDVDSIGYAFRVQVAGATKLNVWKDGGVAIGTNWTDTQVPDNGLAVSGNVVIGTSTAATGYKLSVNGKVMCEELRVQDSGSWPDYVFANNYDLMSLKDLEKYINEHNHLPGISPASEIEEDGFEVGEMSNKLMEKVEELTLYLIDANKRIEQLEKQLEKLNK
jgi:hypothetical protein